jgi:hypothetical protein
MIQENVKDRINWIKIQRCILPIYITRVLPSPKTRKAPNLSGPLNVADSEGFEPPVGLTLRLISSQVYK